MIELTKKQAEYVEFLRMATLDPEIKKLVEEPDLLTRALLLGYVVKEEIVDET